MSSALSPAQLDFLDAVAPAGADVVRAGFPFDAASPVYEEVPMVAASWRNTRQVGWTIYSPEFRKSVALRLQILMDGAGSRLALVTGSCGLQMANAAWPLLRIQDGLRVDVVALGPVCFRSLRVPATVIQGRRDGWSRFFYRGRVDRYCECGHLDYWASDEVRATVGALLR
ncbi:MAG: hypothetical protein HYX27_16960 [Acidobacteria bacterium]|nr:hypothetical protein [Acidobacteriota bacterium]